MAKELPYFKFYINDWFNGDITLETFDTQGFFINVCSYYWSKDCDLTFVNLLKKFRDNEEKVNTLINCGVIKIEKDFVIINFLNEQLQSKEVQTITNRKNGLLGGRPKKELTQNKPNGLIFANRNESESITETKANDNPNETNIKESKVNESKVKETDISNILSFFNFSIENQNHIKQQRLVLAFLTTLKDESYFLTQFEAYKKIKEKEPEFKHSINSFIGNQSNKFEDGKWQDVNWVEKLATVKAKPKEIVYFSQAEKNAIKRRKLKNS